MSIATQTNTPSSQIQIPVEKYQLKNGLRVLLNSDEKASTASYMLGINVGSRHEQPGITGLSHMFEHLMFKGTKKYPHFDKTYAEEGVIGVNAFTSHDYTAYFASFPPEKLELILDVESDRISNLTFSQEELDKERSAVQEERLMAVDNNPSGFSLEQLFDLLFKKHSYRQPIIGYKEDIAAYDLRKLNKWYKTYYSPNNAVLVITGKFPSDEAKELIRKYFGPLESKKIPTETKLVEPEPEKARSRSVNKDVKAPLVKMAYTGPVLGSRESYALEVISHILGSGESSLLYKKTVREKKLLPSIQSTLWDFTDYGFFYISYPLLNLSKEEEIKQLVLETIQQGLSKQIIKSSLEKVKNIQMNNLIFSLKKSSYKASLLIDYEIRLGNYKKLYEKIDTLNSLSPEFIQKTGEKYLNPSRLSYVILRPN